MPIRGRYSPFNLKAFNQKLDHGLLLGLADDDHPQYIKDSEFTQNSGFLVGTGAGIFQEETGNTARTSLGLGTADSPIWTGRTITGCSVLGLDSAVFQPTTDSTTFFQVLDADGGTLVLNVDTTNKRLSVKGTALIAEQGSGDGTREIIELTSDGSVWKGKVIVVGAARAFADYGQVDVRKIRANDGGTGVISLEANSIAINGALLPTGQVVMIRSGTATSIATQKASYPIIYQNSLWTGAASVSKYTTVRNVASTTVGEEYRHGVFVNTNSEGAGGIEVISCRQDGNTGFNEPSPETPIELTHATPYLTLHNLTHEDSDGGRESRLNFKGEQSGGEETTLARIEVGHDGAADDEKGKIVLSTNDGNDTDTPTERIRIDSAGLVTVSGEVEAGAATTKIKLTALGGYAIKLTNKTGGNTVAGQLVAVYLATAVDDAFKTSAANDDGVFGIVLDAGIADGSEAWIVVSGIADVLMDGGGSARGDRIISSVTAGSADVWNVGGAVAIHFQEIGHCIETRTGAGLARCVLHFL